MHSERPAIRVLLVAAFLVGPLVLVGCAKSEGHGSSRDESIGLHCPTARDVSDAIGIQVATVPFKSIPPLEICDFGGPGSTPDDFAAGAPRVQISTAPAGSSVWKLFPLERDIGAGRVQKFGELGSSVRGGQYVESHDAELWVDEPANGARYRLLISYRGAGGLRDAHRALLDLRHLAGLARVHF